MNHYRILEVDRHASQEVIKKAYHVLSKKYHPDRQDNIDSQEFQERMRLINEAYDLLSDAQRRKTYDEESLSWKLWLDQGLIGLAKAWLSDKET